MRRMPREFRAASFELEGRLLLANVPAATPSSPQSVQFDALSVARTSGYLPNDIQVVAQQAGQATVTLVRSGATGSLQVRVWTDQNSPFVGVNVGAVNQIITFADGQAQAAVTVPIISGAANPGKVDVILYVSPTDASTSPTDSSFLLLATLDLRIVASDPALPPKVASTVATAQGILVSFNKPMNPVGASKVKNYAVSLMNSTWNPAGYLGILGVGNTSHSLKSLRLRSAQYDPVSQSVTLIPKRPDIISVLINGRPVRLARTSVRPGHRLNVAHGLTDLQGNPITVGTTPGKVDLRIINDAG